MLLNMLKIEYFLNRQEKKNILIKDLNELEKNFRLRHKIYIRLLKLFRHDLGMKNQRQELFYKPWRRICFLNVHYTDYSVYQYC